MYRVNNLLAIYFHFNKQNFLMLINFSETASEWNCDINLSRVLFQAFATTGRKNEDTCT